VQLLKNIILKYLIAVFFLLTIEKKLHAQTDTTSNEKVKFSAIYGSFGAGWYPPSEMVAEFGLHSFLTNRWGLSITYRSFSFDAINKPHNYSATNFNSGERNNPQDNIAFPTLWFSRALPAKLPYLRFVAQAGVSYVLYSETIFTPFQNTYTNYSTTHEKRQSVGGSLNFKMELMPIRHLGLELGLSAHFNSFRSAFMLDCNLLLGVLRSKTN
jgi:hypothetical protein